MQERRKEIIQGLKYLPGNHRSSVQQYIIGVNKGGNSYNEFCPTKR